MSQEHERIWTTNTREILLTGSAESRLAEVDGPEREIGRPLGISLVWSQTWTVLAALLMAWRLPACGAGGGEGAPGTATVLISAGLWQKRPLTTSVRRGALGQGVCLQWAFNDTV